MAQQELTARAYQYVTQALARFHEVEPQLTIPPDATGPLVSLLRNLESAAADLAAALKAP